MVPSANGHGRRRAVLYARVSTDEQAKKGYSIPEQLGELRSHAAREGYLVVDEVVDDGYTGGDPHRPGLRRIMECAEAEDMEFVLAKKRDRFFRSRFYRLLWDRDLAELGVGLLALNDTGNRFGDAMQDEFSEWEKEEIAKRTADGRLQKAREGKVVAPGRRRYGFEPDPEARCGWRVDEEKMEVVRRIFRMVADGVPYRAVGKTLEREGVPTPRGARFWGRSVLRGIVESDAYRPHTVEELRALVHPDAATGPDPELRYGLYWYNRRGVKKTPASGPPEDGEKQRYHYRWYDKSKEEWVPVPVPDSGIPAGLVDAARTAVRGNRAPSRAGGWFWELSGGVAVCAECGRSMLARHKSTSKNGRRYEYGYYQCSRNQAHGAEACINSRNSSSQNLEDAVWGRVYDFLRRPERLETGLDRLVEEEREGLLADPTPRIERLQEKLSSLDRQRANYQRMAATERMTLDELDERLTEVEEAKTSARRELEDLGRGLERVERLERERDAVLAHYKAVVPSLLRDLPPERRRRVHLALGTEALIDREGGVEVYLRKVRLTLDGGGGEGADRWFGKNGSFSSSTATSRTSRRRATGPRTASR